MNDYWVKGVDLPNLSQPPLRELTDFLTPAENVFFLRHMAAPEIDRREWRLSIGGLVEREVVLSLGDLAAMPQTRICAVHECAGHPHYPTVPVRRVANVSWSGVRLEDVLELSGIGRTAEFIWSYGADSGDYHGVSIPAYVKDLPVSQVQGHGVLLAMRMNEEELSDKHGGPVRFVVPGYYGTNSTKWLVRLELQAARSPGYFTTAMYNDRVVANGMEQLVPVWRMAPHSVIVDPVQGAVLKSDEPLTINGWAWSADEIAKVEVSTDDGKTWSGAELGPREGYAWQRFRVSWDPGSPGLYRLRCRAVDCAGKGQPESGARNSVFSIDVTVK